MMKRVRYMTETKQQEDVITIAVIDDDANIRDGLWWLLNNIIGLRCSGTYGSVAQAVSDFSDLSPDILLLDVSLNGASGIDAIQPLRKRFPSMRIIMHSNYDEQDKIIRSMQAGAAGYVLKNASAVALHRAILKVHAGETVWPSGYKRKGEQKGSKKQFASVEGWLQRLRAFFGNGSQ